MAIHVWSLLCNRVVVDRETNQVSLHDVIESLRIEVVSRTQELAENLALAIPVQFASHWTRSDVATSEKSRGRVVLHSPSKVVGQSDVFEIDLMSHLNARAVMRIPGISVNDTGRYWFVLEEEKGENWSEVSRIPLDIALEVTVEQGQQPAVAVDAKHPDQRPGGA